MIMLKLVNSTLYRNNEIPSIPWIIAKANEMATIVGCHMNRILNHPL